MCLPWWSAPKQPCDHRLIDWLLRAVLTHRWPQSDPESKSTLLRARLQYNAGVMRLQRAAAERVQSRCGGTQSETDILAVAAANLSAAASSPSLPEAELALAVV
jgi:hypothetical protein